MSMEFVTFNNGVTIPQVGLGVFQTPDGEETANAVRWALEAGYRHIDTAKVYGNEASVACLLYTSPSPRDRTRSRMPSSA